jgi:hypothetical protein
MKYFVEPQEAFGGTSSAEAESPGKKAGRRTSTYDFNRHRGRIASAAAWRKGAA